MSKYKVHWRYSTPEAAKDMVIWSGLEWDQWRTDKRDFETLEQATVYLQHVMANNHLAENLIIYILEVDTGLKIPYDLLAPRSSTG